MDELMRLYRQKQATLGQQGRFHSFVGSVSHWGENGAYWGGQAAYSLFTIWERMGRQIHLSYQCETYAFFFLLGSEFLGRTERSDLSSSQLVKYLGGRGGERGEEAHRCLPFRSRVCSTKPAPQKGALPPWKGSLWNLPRLLGNLYRKPPETFTQSPAGKRGENKKAGPPAWETQAKGPAKRGNPIKSVQGYPIRSMENRFANPPVKSPQTRMNTDKNGVDI